MGAERFKEASEPLEVFGCRYQILLSCGNEHLSEAVLHYAISATPVPNHDEASLGLFLASFCADVEKYDGKKLPVRVLADIRRADVVDYYCTLLY